MLRKNQRQGSIVYERKSINMINNFYQEIPSNRKERIILALLGTH